MRVYLAEKKQQGEVITKYLDDSVSINRHDKVSSYTLGNGDVVTWCEGHLYELAMPEYYDEKLQSWSITPLPFCPDKWRLLPKERNRRQISAINNILNGASEVVLCSDYDREGQYLGINAITESGYTGPIFRAKITSLGKVELKRALDGIEDISLTMPLYESAKARSHSDYLVGINLTRFFSCLGSMANFSEKVNIGRVLTPTVNLLVVRETEIAKFKPKDYYELYAQLSVQKGIFQTKWKPQKDLLDTQGYVTDIARVQDVVKKIKGQNFTITNLEKKNITQQPPLPFSLSELQVYCGNHFKMTPLRVLEIAQKLYDNQYTSYPRTDSSYLPESQHSDAELICMQLKNDENFKSLVNGCDLSIKSNAFSDVKMGNSSHNAIIPTTENVNFKSLSEDEFKVYDAIRRRYIAQFYIPAVYDSVSITAFCCDECFTAFGRILKIAGYRIIFTDEMLEQSETEEERELPTMQLGENAFSKKLEIQSKQTRAPKRYTQSSLIHTMEHIYTLVDDPKLKEILKKTKGIGTQATRASIIKNLLDSGWCTEVKDYLYANSKACELMQIIPSDLKSPVTTALWENELEKINSCERSGIEFEKEIFNWVSKLINLCKDQRFYPLIIDHFSKIASASKGKTVTTDLVCPQCKSALKLISTRDKKKFWACTNRDNCNFTTEDYYGKPIIELCPDCKGVIRRYQRKNSKEHFWSCHNCNKFFDDLSGKPIFNLPICPKCQKKMRFSGSYNRDGNKQEPYFYCEGYKDKSCYCKLDRFLKEIKQFKKKTTKGIDHA